MHPAPFSLRPALQEDLRVILTWVDTPELMQRWGGPLLPFPGNPADTWEAMGGSVETTFALVAATGELLGFGQILRRPWGFHLARLMVSPSRRGQGLGRSLCLQLIERARATGEPGVLTLNVYADNAPARALYEGLGFELQPPLPGADPVGLRMALRAVPHEGPCDIRCDDLSGPAIQTLLAEHLQDMQRISPRESVHALDLSGLRGQDITVWTAWSGLELLGCGALKELDPTHGEIKSMRTASAHLRQGVARALLEFILQEARRRGYARLSLETGSQEAFEPARRLYATYGFEPCPPFGGYRVDPISVFMTRSLGLSSRAESAPSPDPREAP